MINGIKKGTIVSTTEDRLTLLNWLKKLEKTLSDDTLTDIAFTDDGGNVSLALTFEDGTTKSVAFPYDMSAFAKKSEVNKPLEFKSALDLNDTYLFELDNTDSRYEYWHLKVQLEDGIYPLNTSAITSNKIPIIYFGPKDGDNLNYHFLKFIQPSLEPAAFSPAEYYTNGLNQEKCNIALSHVNEHSYYIIIDRGNVTFAVNEDY